MNALFHTAPNGATRLNSVEFTRRARMFHAQAARIAAVVRFAHAHGLAL